MNWRFWEAPHTVQSVGKRLLTGLRDGSIVVGERLRDEPDVDNVVLQLDVPRGNVQRRNSRGRQAMRARRRQG